MLAFINIVLIYVSLIAKCSGDANTCYKYNMVYEHPKSCIWPHAIQASVLMTAHIPLCNPHWH